MKMRKSQYWMVVFTMIVGLGMHVPMAGAQLQEKVNVSGSGEGYIDWENAFIYATAIGGVDMAKMVNRIQAESQALKTARYLAYQALSETVNGVRLSSKTLIKNSIMEDDALKVEMEGTLKNAEVVEQKVDWIEKEPRAKVQVRLPVNGDLTYLAAEWAKKPENSETSLPPYTPDQKDKADVVKQVESKAAYSGLIVDARDCRGKPAMSPRLLSSDGKSLVFDSRNADYDAYLDNGFAGYTDTVEKAKANPRVGTNPLIVKAQKARGRNRCDFVLSDEDALQIVAADMKSHFLKDCKTVIVLR